MHKHGCPVLSNLDSDAQDLVRSVGWRDVFPLCPKDSDVDEESNVKIACLIDTKKLGIEEGSKYDVAMDEASIRSIGSQTFFVYESSGFTEDT